MAYDTGIVADTHVLQPRQSHRAEVLGAWVGGSARVCMIYPNYLSAFRTARVNPDIGRRSAMAFAPPEDLTIPQTERPGFLVTVQFERIFLT